LAHLGISAQLKIWQVLACKMGYEVALLSVSQPATSQPTIYIEHLIFSATTGQILSKF
jgi:hypothetical protein